MNLHLRVPGCHLPYMGSHIFTCHSTQVNTLRLNPNQRPELDLPSPEGLKAELTYIQCGQKTDPLIIMRYNCCAYISVESNKLCWNNLQHSLHIPVVLENFIMDIRFV